MGKINNPDLYSLTEAVEGCTIIGSMPPFGSGITVQFDLLQTFNSIIGNVDFVNFQDATKVGQHVMGNVPENERTSAPDINGGGKFFGTIKVFPPEQTNDINYIAKFL